MMMMVVILMLYCSVVASRSLVSVIIKARVRVVVLTSPFA